MKIKRDENLPVSIVDALRTHGHDVDTVADEALAGASDTIAWQAAQQAGRKILTTQDLDFSDVRSFQPGSHAGILLVRLAKPGRKALFARVTSLFGSEEVASWHGCFVVASDRKLRVRRPVV